MGENETFLALFEFEGNAVASFDSVDFQRLRHLADMASHRSDGSSGATQEFK
jgi:hypothetical protein